MPDAASGDATISETHPVSFAAFNDKVMDLATARWIADSEMLSKLIIRTASQSARLFLQNHSLRLQMDQMVDPVPTKDGTAICPGERIALQ